MRARELWWSWNQVSSSSSGLSLLSIQPQSRQPFLAKKKRFWASVILVGVEWAAPHKMCLQQVMELSEHKCFSNTCWSQPDVSDSHVTLWDRFPQAFASVGQKLSLLLAAQVDHMNFPHGSHELPHGCCCSDCNSFPLMLLSGSYIQVPMFSMVCRKSGILKHWIKIFTFLPMDLAIAKPMSISKSWGLKEQNTLGGIIGPGETG